MHAQRRGGATERVYARLRADVLDGELAPGAVLAELEQSARLGVSRTPVREAFAKLVHDGLARPVGGRGLVVAPLDLADLDQLYDVREALEVKAARLAARAPGRVVFVEFADRFGHAAALVGAGELDRYYAVTAEFDAAVDDAVANPWLVRALSDVRTHLARIRRLARHDPARLLAAASEHQLIAEALAAGDADLAAHAVHVHLHRSRSHFREHLTTPEHEESA